MSTPSAPLRSQEEVLNRDFLEVRSRILELAAALDRHDRARTAAPDPRLGLIHQALATLSKAGDHRAEAVQKICSLDYDPDWRTKFGLNPEKSRNGR